MNHAFPFAKLFPLTVVGPLSVVCALGHTHMLPAAGPNRDFTTEAQRPQSKAGDGEKREDKQVENRWKNGNTKIEAGNSGEGEEEGLVAWLGALSKNTETG
jgi:hypothetical protein